MRILNGTTTLYSEGAVNGRYPVRTFARKFIPVTHGFVLHPIAGLALVFRTWRCQDGGTWSGYQRICYQSNEFHRLS